VSAGGRRLRLLVRTARGALPVLVTAAVVPADGCSDRDQLPRASGSDAGGTGEGSGRAGAAGTSGSGSGGSGSGGSMLTGTGGIGGTPIAIPIGGSVAPDAGTPEPGPPGKCTFTVALPPAGVPAEPGQICAATMTPVDSNRAAHVQLEAVNGSPGSVTGTIVIAPSLLGMVVGTPEITVIDATDPALLDFAVSDVLPNPSGFGFRGRWPGPVVFRDRDMTRITVRVAFEAACEDAPQLVHAVTDVHLCDLDGLPSQWVSSGSVCTVCRIIAEMAPSPIVPDAGADGLPLGRVLRLRVVELARVAGTVVLLAENDGGDDVQYEWSASVGTIEPLAPDVIALHASEGMAGPFVQVAAFADDAAAVASWTFNDEVA
jgi:hypothetical protein